MTAPPPPDVIDWRRVAISLDLVRHSRGTSWRAMGRETGLSPATPNRVSRGKAVSAEALIRLLVWAGIYDIRPYLRDR